MSTSLPGNYISKNVPKSSSTREKYYLQIRSTKYTLGAFGFGCSWTVKAKRLSLRIRRGKEEFLHRWQYLDSITIVLIIGI